MSIYFGIMEDVVNYIGEIQLSKSLNWGGGGSFDIKIRDQKTRDLKFFHNKYQNLQDVRVLKMLARRQ